jgi:hypothetical protein
MRFYSESTKPIIGSERTVIRFLFLPKKFHGEWRWFEFSPLRQRFVVRLRMLPDCPQTIDVEEWKTIGWGY